MKITVAQLYRYDLPLTRPLVLKGDTLTVRSGVVLALRDNANHTGYGEIATLPGFSAETLDQAVAQTQWFIGLVIGSEAPADFAQSGGLLDTWKQHGVLFPSVRFGLEAALLNLLAATNGTQLSRTLCAQPRSRISVCALVSDLAPESVEQAHRLCQQGYRAIKVKVGRQPALREAALICDLREAVGPEVGLRADANRAWGLETAITFATEVRTAGLEYLEEPLANPAGLPTLHAATNVPIALDESLAYTEPATLTPGKGIRAFILKPTLLGGIERAMEWVRAAHAWGITPVISAAFESGLGISVLAQLAASANTMDVPAGLDTYRWLAEDVLATRLEMGSPDLDVARVASLGGTVAIGRLVEVGRA